MIRAIKQVCMVYILVGLHLGMGFAGAHARPAVTYTAQIDLQYGNKYYSYGWRTLGECEVRLWQIISSIHTYHAVVDARCAREQDT